MMPAPANITRRMLVPGRQRSACQLSSQPTKHPDAAARGPSLPHRLEQRGNLEPLAQPDPVQGLDAIP
jgi:hypothetical protein